MNIEAINADPALKGTPVGDLKVVQMRGWVGVAIVDRFGRERIVHDLAEGSTVFAAMYGQRAFEGPHIRAVYARRKEQLEAAEERDALDTERDFTRALSKKLQDDDARDTLLRGLSR